MFTLEEDKNKAAAGPTQLEHEDKAVATNLVVGSVLEHWPFVTSQTGCQEMHTLDILSTYYKEL